jgi:hypothetical protein
MPTTCDEQEEKEHEMSNLKMQMGRTWLAAVAVVLMTTAAAAQLAPGTGLVRGVVRTPAGRPASELLVSVSSEADSKFTGESRTDAQGEFAIGDTPAGPVTVLVYDEGRRVVASAQARVKDGEAITLQLKTR